MKCSGTNNGKNHLTTTGRVSHCCDEIYDMYKSCRQISIRPLADEAWEFSSYITYLQTKLLSSYTQNPIPIVKSE